MKHYIGLMAVAMALHAPQAAFAKAAYAPLPQKVAQSDLIARVQITSTRKNVGEDVGQSAYRSIASARIVHSFKGLGKGQPIELEYDNGAVCPNVLYKPGEECLVFLVRNKNGRYSTFNSYYGKYLVKEEAVLHWQVTPYTSRPTALPVVITQIRTHLARASKNPI